MTIAMIYNYHGRFIPINGGTLGLPRERLRNHPSDQIGSPRESERVV